MPLCLASSAAILAQLMVAKFAFNSVCYVVVLISEVECKNGTSASVKNNDSLFAPTANNVIVTSVGGLMPIVGGLLLQLRLTYSRCLLIGMCFLLVTSATASLNTEIEQMKCNEYLMGLQVVGVALASAFVLPALLLGLMLRARDDASRRRLVMMYMTMSGGGDIVGLATRPVSSALNFRLEWTSCILACVATVVVAGVGGDSGGEIRRLRSSRMPSHLRLSQLAQMLVLLPLSIILLTRGVQIVSRAAVFHFGGWTGGLSSLPQLAFELATIATALALVPARVDSRKRILLGLLLSGLSHLVLFCLTLPADGVSNDLLTSAHLAASAVDGVANSLAIGGAYELADTCSPVHCKAFAFGLLYTEWGIGASLSSLLTWAFAVWPESGRTLQPRDGERQNFYIAHVSYVVIATVAIVYARVVTFAKAESLQEWTSHSDYSAAGECDATDEEQEEEEDDEDEMEETDRLIRKGVWHPAYASA